MTVNEFNEKFEKFEGQIPDKDTLAQIVAIIEASGLEIVDEEITEIPEDGLYEMGIQFKDVVLEYPYAFGIGVSFDTIDECGVEEEDWE